MTRRIASWALALALVPLVSLVSGPAARATVFPYTISLNGASENPPNGSPATGTATVLYDDVAHSLDVELSFDGLTAPTTVAHFHAVTATSGLGGDDAASMVANVPPAVGFPSLPGFPMGVTSGTYAQVLDLTDPASWNPDFVTAQGGLAQAEAAFADALATGRTYLNVHSLEFQAGEIRGFPVLVPEPASAALLALGLGALAARRKA